MIKLNNKYLRIFIINHKNTINIEYLVSKAFFNTMDWWAFAPLATTSAAPLKKKMAYCPKPGP